MMTSDQQRRFLDKFAVGDGCWEWQATVSPEGYGQFALSRRPEDAPRVRYAHRMSYELFVGPIPDGLQIDHLCRNRRCVRPDHLEVVTRRENILRGESTSAKNAQKTHCRHGHEYTPENTYIYPDGSRDCIRCRRARRRGDTA